MFFRTTFSLVCVKTGAVALAQPGLTVDCQADEMLVHLEIFKSIFWTKHWKFSGVQEGTVSL